MQLKRIAVMTALVSSMALGSVGNVLADNTPTPVTVPARLTAVAARGTAVADRQGADITSRRAHELARVTGRIDLLNNLVSRLNSDTRLTSGDKAMLLSEDQNALSGLTALKAKIQADTTLAELVADGKTTYSYHVRDVLVPQSRELVMVDNLATRAATLTKSVASMQAKFTALQSKGVNAGAIQTLLTDMANKAAAATTTLANDQKSLEAITPSSTNTDPTFTQVRTDLKGVRSDFVGIRDDAKQIKSNLPKPSATGTATPAATPTP